MRTPSTTTCLGLSWVVWLVTAGSASGAPVDFNFSISYSGQSITGRLVGLNLDANGNGTEIDPTSVLLYHVPAIVGLPASPANPYVFVPYTFERSTYFSGTLSSTTPGVYGFQVSNDTITPNAQNLLMIDAGNDVTLVFNFGAGLCGECGVATYGIMAEEDALWPAVDSFVSYAMVPPVPCAADITGDQAVNVQDLLAVINHWGACVNPPTGCVGDIMPSGGNGQVNVADLLAIINAWGPCP